MALQLIVIIQRADREPYTDEVEYMHTAWLMGEGRTLYTSFFQHHTPLLFAVLTPLVTGDVPASFVRARLLSGAFAMLALLALAAILWHARPEAAPIALALLLASISLWLLGLTAVRAEPFALAFFWCGAALVLLRRDPVSCGAGLALVFLAALWNPKWPFGSLVVAAFWFARAQRRWLSAAVASVIAGLGVIALFLVAPFDAMFFFVVDFNRALWPWLARSVALWHAEFRGGVPFLLAPLLLRPLVVAGAFVLVALALRRFRERHIPLFFLLLAGTSLLELRVVFPWPVLWSHYYLMWCFAGAALIGLIPGAVEALLARKYVSSIVTAGILLIAAANIAALAPIGRFVDRGPRWNSMRYIQERLQPGETVLLDVQRHPVNAFDGDYYWFNFRDVAHVADELRTTPNGARFLPPRTLPFCAMTRGVPTKIRYVSSPRFLAPPPDEERCFAQLLAEGRIRPAPFPDVFEIVRR